MASPEYVEFDGIQLQANGDDGFCLVRNPWVLWHGPAVRGSDRLIPGAAGVRPHRRRATVTKRQLELVIFGDNDIDGDPHTDPQEGLEANVAYIRANITDPIVAEPGTRTVVVGLPSGATMTGEAHVEELELGAISGTTMLAVITLSIPAGALVVVP